jgi:hypothetical protein
VVTLAAVPEAGAGQAGGEVDSEADAGDEDARLDVRGTEAGQEVAIGGDHGEDDGQRGNDERAGRQALGGSGRGDGQAEHEQGADHLGGAGDGQGEHDQEQQPQAGDRDTASTGRSEASNAARFAANTFASRRVEPGQLGLDGRRHTRNPREVIPEVRVHIRSIQAEYRLNRHYGPARVDSSREQLGHEIVITRPVGDDQPRLGHG